ncbi:hypothetical protein KIPB_003095, partial [Kipferlia bialata]
VDGPVLLPQGVQRDERLEKLSRSEMAQRYRALTRLGIVEACDILVRHYVAHPVRKKAGEEVQETRGGLVVSSSHYANGGQGKPPKADRERDQWDRSAAVPVRGTGYVGQQVLGRGGHAQSSDRGQAIEMGRHGSYGGRARSTNRAHSHSHSRPASGRNMGGDSGLPSLPSVSMPKLTGHSSHMREREREDRGGRSKRPLEGVLGVNAISKAGSGYGSRGSRGDLGRPPKPKPLPQHISYNDKRGHAVGHGHHQRPGVYRSVSSGRSIRMGQQPY